MLQKIILTIEMVCLFGWSTHLGEWFCTRDQSALKAVLTTLPRRTNKNIKTSRKPCSLPSYSGTAVSSLRSCSETMCFSVFASRCVVSGVSFFFNCFRARRASTEHVLLYRPNFLNILLLNHLKVANDTKNPVGTQAKDLSKLQQFLLN